MLASWVTPDTEEISGIPNKGLVIYLNIANILNIASAEYSWVDKWMN